MEDGCFLAKLTEHNLLPGDTKDKVKSKTTQADMAEYFISHIITPALEVGSTECLDKLLLVMGESGYDHVKKLSCKIKSEIANRRENSKTSMSCLYLSYSHIKICQ